MRAPRPYLRLAVRGALCAALAAPAVAALGDPRHLTSVRCSLEESVDCPAWTARWDHPEGHAPWSSEPLGNGMDYLGTSVVGGETMFVAGVSRGSSSGLDVLTQAYGVDDGSLRWSVRYDGGGAMHRDDAANDIVATPGGERVYVAGVQRYASLFAGEILVIAYDGATGDELWRRAIYPPTAEGTAYGTSIALAGDAVVVAGQSLNRTTNDAVVYAFSADDGSDLWSRRIVSGGWAVSVAVDEALSGVLVVSTDSLVRLDLTDGSVSWSNRYGEMGRSPYILDAAFAFDEDLAVLVGSEGAWAYDTTTGAVRWSRDAASYHAMSVSIGVASDTIAVSEQYCGCIRGYALDGAQRWSTLADPGVRRQAVGGVTVDDASGVVYASVPGETFESRSGFVTSAIDADDGRRIWARRFGSAGDDVPSRPLELRVAGGRVMVAGSFVATACAPFGCPPGGGVTGGHDFVLIAYNP